MNGLAADTWRTACARLLIAGVLAAMPAVTQATKVYVYEDSKGSRLITDHLRMDPGYRLVKTYRFGGSALRSNGEAPTLRARESSYDGLIARTADDFGVDYALVRAVVHAESSFNPTAVSSKGAHGLMQLMPTTAQRYGVRDLVDPEQNIAGGVRYLRDLLKMFGHNIRLALAAYNAGENAVLRFNGVPPYAETQRYVRKVMHLHQQYAAF